MSGSVNAPFGMRPLEHWNGNPWNGASRQFVSAVSNGAMYIGDPLQRIAGNTPEITGRFMAVKTGAGAASAVNASEDQILGVLIGHEGQFPGTGIGGPSEQLDSDGQYVPASASPAYLLNVVCDANTVYLVQGDEALSSYTDMGQTAFVITGTGSTVTGMSGFVLDVSLIPPQTAADYPVLTIGLLDSPDNDISVTYPLIKVLVNIGWFAPGGYDKILGTLGI